MEWSHLLLRRLRLRAESHLGTWMVVFILLIFSNGLACGAAKETATASNVKSYLTLETVQDHKAFSAAQRALGELKDPQALDALVQALRHDDTRVQFLAVIGLNSLKNPKSLDALIEYAERHKFPEIATRISEDEKAKIEGQARWELLSLLVAVNTLGELGDKKATRVIVPLLGVKELRGAPEEAYIRIMGVKSVLERKPKNDHEAQAMSNKLAGIRDPKEIPQLMTIVADREMGETMRCGAIAALRYMAAKEATELLDRIANDPVEPSLVRSSSLVSLAQIAPAKYIPIIEKSLPAEEDWLVRRAVVRGLGQLRLKVATKLVMTMLEDPREDIRFVAADALASCSGIPYEAVVEENKVEIRWAPSEKLFPEGKVLVFTGRVAQDVKDELEYRKTFGR